MAAHLPWVMRTLEQDTEQSQKSNMQSYSKAHTALNPDPPSQIPCSPHQTWEIIWDYSSDTKAEVLGKLQEESQNICPEFQSYQKDQTKLPKFSLSKLNITALQGKKYGAQHTEDKEPCLGVPLWQWIKDLMLSLQGLRSGCCCGMGMIPGPGTFTCLGCGQIKELMSKGTEPKK